MFSFSNPVITFSRDTGHSSRRSERQDKYLDQSASHYPSWRSRGTAVDEENRSFSTLMKIRQAVSAATMDHTQKTATTGDDRSRPSSQRHSRDRYISTENQVIEFPEISMLGNDLFGSRGSSSRSRRRSRSTDSSASESRSTSSTTAVPLYLETSPSQHIEGTSTSYKRSTDNYNSRRTRPYASYYGMENSTFSDYEATSQTGSWDSPPPSETTRSYRSASGTPEPSIYEELLQSSEGNHTFYTEDAESDYLPRKTTHTSRPDHTHKPTPDINIIDTIYISRTPSLTSTQNSPPSTPSSYSDSSFIISDYSLDQEPTSTTIHAYQPTVTRTAPLAEPSHPTTTLPVKENPPLIRHFSKPRRFLRTTPKPHSRENSITDRPVLLVPHTEPISEYHGLSSPPISPMTPSMVLPILHFPSATDSHVKSSSKAAVSMEPAKVCSVYASAEFNAGLYFGIPAPELGIRLASLENMAERQSILFGKKVDTAR